MIEENAGWWKAEERFREGYRDGEVEIWRLRQGLETMMGEDVDVEDDVGSWWCSGLYVTKIQQ